MWKGGNTDRIFKGPNARRGTRKSPHRPPSSSEFERKARQLNRFGAVRVAVGQVKACKWLGCIALALGSQRRIGCVAAERAGSRYVLG